jgi:hypothetical protein
MANDGYRYVRQYRVTNGSVRWALYERQAVRARRVGTAHTALAYLQFLRISGELLARSLRYYESL